MTMAGDDMLAAADGALQHVQAAARPASRAPLDVRMKRDGLG